MSNQQLNILFIVPSLYPRISGVTFRYKYLFDNLDTNTNYFVAGYDNNFHIYLNPRNLLGFIYLPCISVPSYPTQKTLNLWYILSVIYELRYIIIQHNINVIHCAGPDLSFFVVMILKIIFPSIFVVYGYHTDIYSYLQSRSIYYNNIFTKSIIKYFDSKLINYANICWFMSTFVYDRIIYTHKYDLIKTNIKIMKIGIDHSIFKPTQILNKSNTENKILKLLIISRLSPEKDIIKVIDVVKQLSINVSLTIIGEGPDESEIITSIGKSNFIQFLGKREHHELTSFYNNADLFIQPSQSETLGFTIIESLACGTPVINIKNGSHFIIHNYNGFIFNDWDEFKILLNSIYLDFDKEKYSNNCIDYVSKINWKDTTDDMLEIYREQLH